VFNETVSAITVEINSITGKSVLMLWNYAIVFGQTLIFCSKHFLKLSKQMLGLSSGELFPQNKALFI
jgi:hypothetical protein